MVEGVELAINRLQSIDGDFANDRAVETNERETLECGLVIYSIGYKTLNIDPKLLPFDTKNHVVHVDTDGRVGNLENLYACGWCSRGPVGVLATTQNHAKYVADTIRQDATSGRFSKSISNRKNGSDTILELLKERNVRHVTWNDWTKIDRIEKERGAKIGKPREKIVDQEELLKIASGS